MPCSDTAFQCLIQVVSTLFLKFQIYVSTQFHCPASVPKGGELMCTQLCCWSRLQTQSYSITPKPTALSSMLGMIPEPSRKHW